MAIIDIIISIILLIGIYRGFTKGFVYTVAIAIAFVLGVIGSFQLVNKATDYFRAKFSMTSEYLPFISFLVVFIGIVILVLLLSKLIENVLSAGSLGWLNKIAGAFLGAFKMAFFISVLFWVMKPVEKKLPVVPESQKQQSFLYGPVSKIAPVVLPTLKEGYTLVKDKINKE